MWCRSDVGGKSGGDGEVMQGLATPDEVGSARQRSSSLVKLVAVGVRKRMSVMRFENALMMKTTVTVTVLVSCCCSHCY